MYTVKITLLANTSKYWAHMEFKDNKGMAHRRVIEKEQDASQNSNYIRALIAAAEALNRPCMLDIFTSCEYLVAPFKQGWITNWEKNNWTNAKGTPVRNAEQWKELREKLTQHSVRFMITDKAKEIIENV